MPRLFTAAILAVGLATFGFTATPARAAERVALVIGNGKYTPALKTPANDAADMAKTLRTLGFDVIEGRDLDKAGMEGKAQEFSRRLEGASLALFYYSGRGIEADSRNFLVPVNARLQSAEDIETQAIGLSSILAQMEAARRVSLVFLDTGRDNPLPGKLSPPPVAAAPAARTETMLVYATQSGGIPVAPKGRNSTLTAALLKHIGSPGIEIGAAMSRVRADVVQATGGKQIPWSYSSVKGDIVLKPKAR